MLSDKCFGQDITTLDMRNASGKRRGWREILNSDIILVYWSAVVLTSSTSVFGVEP